MDLRAQRPAQHWVASLDTARQISQPVRLERNLLRLELRLTLFVVVGAGILFPPPKMNLSSIMFNFARLSD